MHEATSTTTAAWWVDVVFVPFPCCGSDGQDVLGSKPLFPPVKNCCLTKSCISFCINIPQDSSVGTIFNCCRMFFITLQVQKDCELPSKGSSCDKKVHRVDWELQHPGRLCTARTIISHPIITFALRMQDKLCTYDYICTYYNTYTCTSHHSSLRKTVHIPACHYTIPSLSTFHFCYIEVYQSQTSLWNRQPYWPLALREWGRESMNPWVFGLDRVLIEPRKFLPESSYCYVISWIFKGCWLNKKGGFTVEDIIVKNELQQAQYSVC